MNKPLTFQVRSAPAGQLLTAADVAERLRVSPKTVRRMRIPSVAVGTGRARPRLRYRLEDVEAWIRSRAEGR